MVGKLLCFLGIHSRDSWISPTQGGGHWRSHCPRCGCDLARDTTTGRWVAATELTPQQI